MTKFVGQLIEHLEVAFAGIPILLAADDDPAQSNRWAKQNKYFVITSLPLLTPFLLSSISSALSPTNVRVQPGSHARVLISVCPPTLRLRLCHVP